MPIEFTYTDIKGWDQTYSSYGKSFLREAIKSLVDSGYLGGHPELPNGCSVLFGKHGNKIVACMVYTYDHDLNGIYLHIAYVSPGYRAMGMFSSMLEIMKSKARDLGIETVSWEVLVDNHSMHSVSRKLGTTSVIRYEVTP